jgi:hypothetical protein
MKVAEVAYKPPTPEAERIQALEVQANRAGEALKINVRGNRLKSYKLIIWLN